MMKFDQINNFDRLYNKRIDWKPLLIQEKRNESLEKYQSLDTDNTMRKHTPSNINRTL